MTSATIKMFLAQGDSKRLRTAELSNWSGKGIAAPRTELDIVLHREEASKSGVYFLTGNDPESGRNAVYIGEAEIIRDRLKRHLDKDFWNHLVFFTSKDDNLTKSHIKYLEGRLIDQAKQVGRAILINGQSSGARLSESDAEDMEVFLEKIHLLLPILGIEFLLSRASSITNPSESQILFCETKGIKATGQLTPNGLVIHEGSQAVLNERPSSQKWPWASKLRQNLIEDGALITKTDFLLFKREVEFSSPSAAAAVVCGGHTNGLIAWKDSKGKPLKEIESK